MATITKRPRKALLLHDTEGTKNFGRKTNCLARLRYSSSFNYAASNRLKAMSPKLKYDVYSQGSWRQAFFAALPHLLVAALFAMRCWKNTFWLIGMLIAIAGSVIYGWCRGKPAWLFPWLGYCLIPVMAGGILLIYF